MKEIETAPATPEHLMQMLEASLAVQRARSQRSSRNRMMFLVGGVLFIVLGAGGALLVLMQMLSELQPGGRAPREQTTVQEGHGNF